MKEVIEGWIARDEDNMVCYHTKEPHRVKDDIFMGLWESENGESGELPKTMFPDLKWKDEPRKVLITIETIELDS